MRRTPWRSAPRASRSASALVVVAVLVSWRRQLRLERPLVEATLRALAQLVAVGYGLRVLLDPDVSVWWSVGWVAFMVAFAAWTIDRRVDRGRRPRAAGGGRPPGVAAVVTLGTVFALGVFPFEARYLVPLAGHDDRQPAEGRGARGPAHGRRAGRAAAGGRGAHRARPAVAAGVTAVRPACAARRADAPGRDHPGGRAWSSSRGR